jgi:HEPN domain-containing protein
MQPDEEKAQLTRAWLVKARNDLLVADRAVVPPPVLSIAAFLAQQAAEKILKAYLTWCDQSFRRTHELETLLRQCMAIDPEFAELSEAAKALAPYAVGPRYPGPASEPTQEQAEAALRFAREIMAFVLDRLPPEARPH